MESKHEGAAFPPVPSSQGPTRGAAKLGPRVLREGVEPRCEMCGHEVIAAHCKRICLRCGFMTGCSEGL
jgi:hypothetical protein